MKKYWKYIKPYLAAFILAPILMLTEVLGEIILPKLTSMIINNGVAGRDIGYIMRAGAIMVGIAAVMALGGIGGAYFSAKASISFSTDLRRDIFHKVQQFSFKNIDDFSTGSLITRLTNDIQQIQNVIYSDFIHRQFGIHDSAEERHKRKSRTKNKQHDCRIYAFIEIQQRSYFLIVLFRQRLVHRINNGTG